MKSRPLDPNSDGSLTIVYKTTTPVAGQAAVTYPFNQMYGHGISNECLVLDFPDRRMHIPLSSIQHFTVRYNSEEAIQKSRQWTMAQKRKQEVLRVVEDDDDGEF